VAWQFARLQELADRSGCRWRYEGTVADGMPVFGLLEFCLRHCDVHGFDAIFNATTNFIIEAVGEGRDFADALAQVQAEGYAEADPSHDIDGVDAACKTAALANVAMNARITPDDIPKESIRGLTPERVRAATADGHKLCVLCSAARRPDGGVEAAVRLTEIPLDHPLAPVKGSSLGVVLHTDLMADVVVAEMAALVPQTAYAIYADLLALRSPAG
jgi:homoserine dehydrogenase